MKRDIFNFSGVAILSVGLLLTAPGMLAQMRGGSNVGGQSGNMNQNQNMNQPGMPQNMQQNGQMGMQNNAQASFFADARRNSKVETDLSKLALKNSSNENIKTFAQQVISENHRNETMMTSAASNQSPSGMQFGEPIPTQTRKAEKDMKKLTGVQFDAMYLGQMTGYVKNDQKILSEASSLTNSPDIGSLIMQLRNTADQRASQIAQVAQSENIKLQ